MGDDLTPIREALARNAWAMTRLDSQTYEGGFGGTCYECPYASEPLDSGGNVVPFGDVANDPTEAYFACSLPGRENSIMWGEYAPCESSEWIAAHTLDADAIADLLARVDTAETDRARAENALDAAVEAGEFNLANMLWEQDRAEWRAAKTRIAELDSIVAATADPAEAWSIGRTYGQAVAERERDAVVAAAQQLAIALAAAVTLLEEDGHEAVNDPACTSCRVVWRARAALAVWAAHPAHTRSGE